MNNRTEQINSYLQKRGTASIRELASLFPEVSEMTIRRDLEALEKSGEIVRTRGGAKSIRSLLSAKEEAYTKRTITNPKGKKNAAIKALPFAESGLTIFLDAGTTIMSLATLLPDMPMHIITNAPNIAMEILKKQEADVYLAGGAINRDNVCVASSTAYHMIENINIDLAFMVTSGFSEAGAFSSGNLDESELKRLVIQKAGRVVMLVDSSKFEKTLPYTFARLEEVDILISDQPIPLPLQEEAKRYNIKLL